VGPVFGGFDYVSCVPGWRFKSTKPTNSANDKS
jgi:hypothetical protein